MPSFNGPYPPKYAQVGGVPTINSDIPVSAVFLALYVAFAATNMTLFQLARKRDQKFIISWALFGFCMARILTNIMRIVWAAKPHNVRVAMAASILNNAGVLVIYIVNLLFAQRKLRSLQPRIGWNRWLSLALQVVYGLVAAMLVMLITTIVLSDYTLDKQVKDICTTCLEVASTVLLAITVLPLPLLAVAYGLPRRSEVAESFGHGSPNTRVGILVAAILLAITIQGFKVGTAFMPPRPLNDPAWYDSQAAFYVFGFTLEILILAIFDFGRVDKRFFVPNGSSKRRTYQVEQVEETDVRESSDDSVEEKDVKESGVDSV